MRVVAYVRMSTGKQETSPARQRDEIAKVVRAKGYTLVETYEDLARSGGLTSRRAGFLRMIADAKAKKFQRIVCYDLSRFGRFDSIEAGQYIQPLRDAGVTLETLDDGLVDWTESGGRIVSMVKHEGRHDFLIDTSKATLTGQQRKAAANAGFHGAPTSYGFNRNTTLTGRSRLSVLEHDPETASVVARIFHEYNSASGSLKGVARILNDDKVPSPRGAGHWRSNTILRILTNPAYVGDSVWGKTNQGKHHERSQGGVVRRKSFGTVPAEAIVNRDTHTPIVSRETFAATQRLLGLRRKETRSSGAIRPLSGLVVCGACGARLHNDGPTYLRCPGSSPDLGKSRTCSGARVPTAPLLKAVVAALKAKLLEPKRLEALEAAVRREATKRAGGAAPARRRDLEAQRRKLQQEIAAGVDRLTQVPASIVADLQKALDRKAKEREDLDAEIAAIPTAPLDLSAVVRAGMAALRQIAEVIDRADPAAVNAALRAAGVVVRVTPVRKSAKGPRVATVTLAAPGDLSRTSRRCEQVGPSTPMIKFNVTF
jgi:DNA invertase Pin-like site-specific DNA recombinase